MKKIIYQLFEEIFPIFPFLKSKNSIQRNIKDVEILSKRSDLYKQLNTDSLDKRIKEEHERGVKIDDKTSKFTLGLSVSLTVLAAVSGSIAKYLPDGSYTTFIAIVCGIAALYMLLAGIIALGALKTLPTYGYGTEHVINLKEKGISYLAEALFAQEQINIIRQLRNEAAYQSLRNGFILLFFALLVSVSSHGSSVKLEFLDSSNKGAIARKNNDQAGLGGEDLISNKKTVEKVTRGNAKTAPLKK